MTANPFIFGNPITDPQRFIGRLHEIEQIRDRLLNPEFESSSIVGERRMGKTSLLKCLTDPSVSLSLGMRPETYIPVYVDLQVLDPAKTPTDFWRRLLGAIRRLADDRAVRTLIDDLRRETTIDAFLLDDLFFNVDESNLYIILLLDEFERVTRNKNFGPDFFSGLRAMAIHHNLALITSSRRELDELTHSKEIQDSPFFNIFTTIYLRPFSPEEARGLIHSYLEHTGIAFTEAEVAHVLDLSGGNPYFLQMACSFLFQAHQHGGSEAERRQSVDHQFRETADPMFESYWGHSSVDERVLLAALSLLSLERHVRGGITLEELRAHCSDADRTLRSLDKRGLVLEGTQGARPFSPVFARWLADELVAPAASDTMWAQWKSLKAQDLVNLPLGTRRRVLDLLPRLNSAHADSLGNWLLNPATVDRALLLLEDFAGLDNSPQPDDALVTLDLSAYGVLLRSLDQLAAQVGPILLARGDQTPVDQIPFVGLDPDVALTAAVDESAVRDKERQILDLLDQMDFHWQQIQELDIHAAPSAEGNYPVEPDLAALHQLLSNAFTTSGLRRFCRERRPFAPLLTEFQENPSLDSIIDDLLDYCQREVLFRELLSEVHKASPSQYERHRLRLCGDSRRAQEDALLEAGERLAAILDGLLIET